jgi:hypothetical protein
MLPVHIGLAWRYQTGRSDMNKYIYSNIRKEYIPIIGKTDHIAEYMRKEA